MKSVNLGNQYLVEFYGCCVETINDKVKIRDTMIQAAKIANATIVADIFHQFNPHGISGVVVIAESHIAIHTWPEYQCVSVDIFTCSAEMKPEGSVDYLRTIFKAQRVKIKKVARGQHLLQSVIRFKMNESFFGAKGGECPQQYHLQKNQKENQSPLKE